MTARALTPEARARRVAELMAERDAASKWFGIALESVGAGTARASLEVAAHHANGVGLCHGAVIFALADTAMGYACNSYNRRAVSQHDQVSFLKPAHVGQRLNALVHEVTRSGRSGIYDATVTADGAIVATFRGVSREIGGVHFDEGDEDGALG